MKKSIAYFLSTYFVILCLHLSAQAQLQVDVRSESTHITPNTETFSILFDAQAPKVTPKTTRPPMNIALVLDRSGSMSGDKLHYAKKACEFVVDNLSSQDYLSLVIYDNEVNVLQHTVHPTNKQQLKQLIKGVTDRGSTNLSGGVLEGYNQAKAVFDAQNVNRVFLLSDGLANEGITDPEKLKEIARTKNLELQLGLSTFGVGSDFDELLMTGMAEQGSGNYYFIDSPDKIPEIFKEELKGLLSVYAQNATLKVSYPTQYMQLQQVNGYEYQITPNQEILINFRDIISEELKSVLFTFSRLNTLSESLTFTFTLTYDDAETFERKEVRKTIHVNKTQEESVYYNNRDPKVLQMSALFQANQVYEKAMLLVDQGATEKAKALLKKALENLSQTMSTLPEDEELTAQYNAIKVYYEQIDSYQQMSSQEQKMYQKSQRNVNYKMKKRKK
ncbi:vWA domain-containing protein [Algivirga pacifica]|uniref:VWA domain-containing protein n=1 Tax=Algivirga pacifica TaxID=1162670 RepID=A0ABP9D8U5_9BACT